MGDGRYGWGALLGVVSGLGIVVGTTLPWGQVHGSGMGGLPGGSDSVAINGTAASGLVILPGVAAAVISVLVWTGLGRRRGGALIGLCGLFTVIGVLTWLLTAQDSTAMSVFGMGRSVDLQFRYGVWVALGASVVGLASAILLIDPSRMAGQAMSEPPSVEPASSEG